MAWRATYDKANDRHPDALAGVDESTQLRELAGPFEKPATWNGKWVRALHPFEDQDRLLLETLSRGEFPINGLRNKDLQPLLYSTPPATAQESRRRSAAISRKLRLLRAHHPFRKVSGIRRYQVSPKGRQILTAALAASHATVNALLPKAAR